MSPRAQRSCPTPGCPALIPPGTRYCPACSRDYEQRRGTRQQRGYDRDHDKLRARWQRVLDRGTPVACTSPTCLTPGDPIDPQAWDLGHNEQRQHRGPEHAACNRSAGGRAAHGA